MRAFSTVSGRGRLGGRDESASLSLRARLDMLCYEGERKPKMYRQCEVVFEKFRLCETAEA